MTEPNDPQSPLPFLLCPGQGAQAVGMARAWYEASPGARVTIDQANDVLGYDLRKLMFEGPDEELQRTDNAQPAIYTASVACCRALIERGELAENQFRATAGLSLGEFTALHLAGAYSFEDGLKLVRLRGEAMQDAATAGPSTMVALTGDVSEDKVNEVCDKARGDGILVPANFNSPMQVVVSGSIESCGRVPDIASELGLKATPLTVAGAFHSPIMQPAADRLAEALTQVSWNPLKAPVIANVTGLPHDGEDVQSIQQKLVEQLTSPVRWSQSMQWAVENSPGRFVELAPGKVLSGLMKRIDRKTKVENFAEPG